MSWIGCWIWSCSITGIHSFNSDRCLTRPSENLYEFTPNSSAGETRICLRKLGWGVSSTKGRGAGLGEAASGRQGAVFPRRAHGAPSGAGRAQCRPLHPECARGPGVPASSRSPRGARAAAHRPAAPAPRPPSCRPSERLQGLLGERPAPCRLFCAHCPGPAGPDCGIPGASARFGHPRIPHRGDPLSVHLSTWSGG